jgi:hypothetical protein
MGLPVTSLYAGALGLAYLALTARVIVRRRARRVAFGDGGDAELARRVRTHANFAE